MAEEKSAVKNNHASWLAAFGAVSGAYSSYVEGQTERMLLEHNAVMAEFDAGLSKLKTDFNVKILKEQGEKLMGAGRVAAGASGFKTDAGSNLDAVEDIRRGIEMDAAVLRATGELEAYGFRSEAGISRARGEAASRAGRTRAVNTLLSGATKIAELGR